MFRVAGKVPGGINVRKVAFENVVGKTFSIQRNTLWHERETAW